MQNLGLLFTIPSISAYQIFEHIVFAFIVRTGGDVLAKHRSGRTCLQVAKEKELTEIIQILKDAGK